MGLFDDLLQQVAEEDRAVFQKYPKLAERIDKTADFVGKWETWKDEHWDAEKGMTKGAVAEIEARDMEIEALRLMQGNEMTWEEIKGNVEGLIKSQKVMTADAFEKEVMPKLNYAKPEDIDGLRKELGQFSRGMDLAYAKSAHLPMKYLREFGNEAPEFTMEALFKHMGEKKINDFDQAFNSFVEPLRTAKQEAVVKAREEEIRQQAREEARKEYSLAPGALPIDSSGSAPEMSALKLRMENRRAAKTGAEPPVKLTPGALGEGVAAQDAYSQYLKDMAAGVKPKLPSYINVQ